LIQALKAQGYAVIGPTVREGAIAYEELKTAADLPVGWADEQERARYRLKPRGDDALFGYNASPQSWKRFLNPPAVRLWQAEREDGIFRVIEEERDAEKFAFVGVRACELRAIAIQDQIFIHSQYVEPGYKARRENAFILAVNCTQAGGTCFCTSMHSGPQAESGFDLALTEVLDGERHYLLFQVGTELGASILAPVPHAEATTAEKDAAASLVAQAAAQMGRRLDTHDLKEILQRNYANPLWDQVAARCLTCANCTMVCPTCFCTTLEDVTDLAGTRAERWRKWDSCFTLDFTYIHGGSIRTSPMSRYRQWLMHKFATWIDQFGTPGCVGCGRCITWCPAAIDITEQAQAIRDGEHRVAEPIPAERGAA
jgi:formate hydrogenlyase subunit 6/NADH:ubiquinone oxidoreductase subunit I